MYEYILSNGAILLQMSMSVLAGSAIAVRMHSVWTQRVATDVCAKPGMRVMDFTAQVCIILITES